MRQLAVVAVWAFSLITGSAHLVLSNDHSLIQLSDQVEQVQSSDLAVANLTLQNNLDRITLPGTGIHGTDASMICTDPICGSGRLVNQSLFCDNPICTRPFFGCLNAPFRDVCGFPARQTLPEKNGASDLTFIRESFSELVVVGIRNEFGKPWRTCTGTLIAQNWAIAAFHCFTRPELTQSNVFALFDKENAAVDNWTKLSLKTKFRLPIVISNPQTEQIVEVSHLFVPYNLGEMPIVTKAMVPSRDIVLLKLKDPISLPSTAFPFINSDLWENIDGQAISFSGYGYTNSPLVSFTNKELRFDSPEWLPRRFSAYNFSIGSRVHIHDAEVIQWRQGNLGGNGGPCSTDSGGPVYGGFNRGYWDDPKLLVGIVSAIYGREVSQVDDCLASSGLGTAILLNPYADGICNLTGDGIRGCGN